MDPLQRVDAFLDQLAGVHIPGERDDAHVRVADERVADRHAVSRDDVEHAGREDVRGELGQLDGGERGQLRRLEDDLLPVASAGPIFQIAIISG